LLFVIAGLALGILVPKITALLTVSSGRIVDLLFIVSRSAASSIKRVPDSGGGTFPFHARFTQGG
jgi:hypothetical protein